ncbi:PH domain-containing protein [Nocardia bovistercoris]|uniref:PH domain-containing protein n=1 Tax=Nocardia bovistercoris TaxID=2785916 RepID=UPI001E544F01|nr:PH domain-containing protein [Nocardia bovistercoris]
MLLVHPVTEVIKFIPVLVGMLILGNSFGNHVWGLLPLALIVAFALTRWFTTTYRIGPTHVELRTGLLQRRKLSVPRSRIRSVDVESDLLHRVLGLAVVVIGTGQQADSGEKFKLDSLDLLLVPELRAELLAHLSETPKAVDTPKFTAPAATPPEREIGHWRASWVRYAPLSLTGFAVIAPIAGLALQYGLGEVVFNSDAAHTLEEGTAALIAVTAVGLLATIVALVSLAACTRYLATYYGLRVLDNGRTLHLRYGLFTTRQLTLDLARFRGATVNEPLLLRLAGAAELEAVMVGENARQKLLPQAPRAAVERTLTELLASRAAMPFADSPIRDAGTASWSAAQVGAPSTAPDDPSLLPPSTDATDDDTAGERGPSTASAAPEAAVAEKSPISVQGAVTLIPHGPAARRRRYTRALTMPGIAACVLLALLAFDVPISPWWLLVSAVAALLALPLAEDRYRGLGHAVIPGTATTPAWLITRSGSLDRDRDCLEGRGIIGWTVSQSFWQRRAGIASVVAATAAGKKRYLVTDLPLADAYALIEAVTPGLTGTHEA